MALKDNYSRQISLRCMTCGATYAFETDAKTGYVTCHKCNRVYRGGEEELISLNEALIEDEKEQMFEEVRKDVEKEFQKKFKNIKIKL
ncbi:MAG: hypothetical protein ACI3ZK_02940 [Candidatus Cryptobacteroides sp.]